MRKLVLLISFFVLTTYAFNISVYAEDVPDSKEQPAVTANDDKSLAKDATNEDEEIEDIDIEMEATFVKDPIRKYNRAIFGFNDKLYFYFMKPMYKGYNKVVPEKARLSVRKFFSNIRTPVRFFNCLFQGKFKGAGTELSRLVINTTLGLGGLFDPAKSQFNLEKQDEDFGQTLGKHGMGSNYYIQWPFLGPSNARDTIGFVGDVALDPLTLLTFFVSPYASIGAKSYDTFNEVSIDRGETYENIVEPAIDPYIALQDAYTQNRIKKIKE